jgi:hypothetical protein
MRGIVAEPLLHQLRQQQREGIEHQAGDDRDQQQHDDRAAHQVARDVGKWPRSLSHDGLGSRQSPPRETERDAGDARQQEGGAPAGCIGEQRGHHRCQRHSQIAEHAVHADGAARLVAGGVHQHGGADRMVDRREQSSGRERDRQHHRRTGKRRRRHREAGAEKEQRHQRRPADALRNPPLRQREQPVEQEHARASARIGPYASPNRPSGTAIASTAVGRINSE